MTRECFVVLEQHEVDKIREALRVDIANGKYHSAKPAMTEAGCEILKSRGIVGHPKSVEADYNDGGPKIFKLWFDAP